MFFYYRARVGLAKILSALNVGAGDLVALQGFTCVAVPEAIKQIGATPLWIDVEANGVTMSVESLAERLDPPPKVVIVQHTYGIPCRIQQLQAVAGDIPLIEDCCHTYSSTISGQKVGSFGVASFFSFEWGKPVVAGVGGGVSVNDRRLLDKLNASYRHLRAPSAIAQLKIQAQLLAYSVLYTPRMYWIIKDIFHAAESAGLIVGNYGEDDDVLGNAAEYHLKMAYAQQVLAEIRLKSVDQIAEHSKQLTDMYHSALRGLSGLELVDVPSDCEVRYIRFPLLVNDKKKLIAWGRSKKIELSSWYDTPVHPLSGDALSQVDYEAGMCPNAEHVSRHIVTVPAGPKVTFSAAQGIADALRGECS